MWIRSQDKDSLVEIKDFHINEVKTGNYRKLTDKEKQDIYKVCENSPLLDYNYRTEIIVYKINNLATYSTKDKALKVLDMIQACISKDFSKLSASKNIEAVKLIHEMTSWGISDCAELLKNNFIFQMPQDTDLI